MSRQNESFLQKLNFSDTIFSHAFLNRQEQLCINLDRPIIFKKILSQVDKEKSRYGVFQSDQQPKVDILFVHCPCALRCATENTEGGQHVTQGNGCGFNCGHSANLSLAEVRICVLADVMLNILRASEHRVHPHRSCSVSQLL